MFTHTRSVVESPPWLEKNIQTLGSNPADCPIFRHYLLSQAIYDFTSPLSKETLGDTEALRVSQHQGVY